MPIDYDLLQQVKEAAPKWVKMLQAGKLSPDAINTITSKLPEGSIRQIKHLGQGQGQIADLMAGNIGSTKGIMVRKLPKQVTNLEQVKVNNLEASNILDKKFPGMAARYLPANNAKGVFQEYGDKAPYPNWPGHENLALSSPAAKTIIRMGEAGVRDMHAGNFGPKGQLIDYMYKLPSGQWAGNVSMDNRIDWFNQGIGKRKPYIQDIRSANADAVRKYWLGNKIPLQGEQAILNSPVVSSSPVESKGSAIIRAFATMPGFKQLRDVLPRLRGFLKAGAFPAVSRRFMLTKVPKSLATTAGGAAVSAVANPAAAAAVLQNVVTPSKLRKLINSKAGDIGQGLFNDANMPRRDFVKAMPAITASNMPVTPTMETAVKSIPHKKLVNKLKPYLIPGGMMGSTIIPALSFAALQSGGRIRMPMSGTIGTMKNTLHGSMPDITNALESSPQTMPVSPVSNSLSLNGDLSNGD